MRELNIGMTPMNFSQEVLTSKSFHPNYAVIMSKGCLSRHLKLYYRFVLHTFTYMHWLLTRHTIREVSQLYQSESYFSDVKRMDKEGHGYPKGPTIHKLIGKCATVNAYKHKATKYEHVHFS